MDIAPSFCACTEPSLNNINVGMLRMPNLGGVFGIVVNIQFGDLSRGPRIASAASSSSGAIILQGPHHSAQKSSRTGFVSVVLRRPQNCRHWCGRFSRSPAITSELSSGGFGNWRPPEAVLGPTNVAKWMTLPFQSGNMSQLWCRRLSRLHSVGSIKVWID